MGEGVWSYPGGGLLESCSKPQFKIARAEVEYAVPLLVDPNDTGFLYRRMVLPEFAGGGA